MQQNEQITDLVKRAVKGDRDAMSDLYTHTCQRTYRTILGLVRDEQTAQDLTQETYMLFRAGPAGGPGPFSALAHQHRCP